ncbi:MAG: UDP-N-acetylmuramate--L-alanine ligase [Candidatus Hatepunaea meridiana]|nr:UDP-N-acetylmuramate--L-alanine ligase [Candidatus Hatepunaea meridiana]
MNRFRRLHMVGIGGSGMSGIAEILLKTGFYVSGSDQSENEATQRLIQLGAKVFKGHNASYIENADVVVFSSAIHKDHIELVAARERKIPVIRRSRMLAELMRMKAGIAISGTHGKTTTTSLAGEILIKGGLDPTVIVGGRLRRMGTGVVSGKGDFLVAEADEFDKSFLSLTPTIVAITNIDDDHIECYGNYEELENAFVQFAQSVPFYGRTLVCIDEPSLVKILPRLDSAIITYGFSPQADVRAVNAVYNRGTSTFTVEYDNQEIGKINLPLPGRHNILNTLAAVGIARELGVEFNDIRAALESFKGVYRRFEMVGEVNGILFADDFAHHPAEISATLSAAKEGWKCPILAVFQPHLYSRTQALAQKFGRALLGSDTAIVLPIYPAREKPIEGVTAKLIVDAAKNMGHKNIHYLEDKSMVTERVKELSKEGDFVITIGAGDVYKLAPQIMAGMKDEEQIANSEV